MLRSLALLSKRPGLFRNASEHLIAAAVNASTCPEQLISDMWICLRTLKEFLPEVGS